MYWLIAIIFGLVWSGVNAAAADEKGRSGVGIFFMSMLISPLLMTFYLMMVPALERVEKPEGPPSKAAKIVVIVGGVLFVVILGAMLFSRR